MKQRKKKFKNNFESKMLIWVEHVSMREKLDSYKMLVRKKGGNKQANKEGVTKRKRGNKETKTDFRGVIQ
jgi:hypothetical protein